jgi:hypothetical protein
LISEAIFQRTSLPTPRGWQHYASSAPGKQEI